VKKFLALLSAVVMFATISSVSVSTVSAKGAADCKACHGKPGYPTIAKVKGNSDKKFLDCVLKHKRPAGGKTAGMPAWTKKLGKAKALKIKGQL